jgi:hypothetical protein
VLLDENMKALVGDFGLSVDLAAASEGEGGIYSGDEGAKIPVRWASIEVRARACVRLCVCRYNAC